MRLLLVLIVVLFYTQATAQRQITRQDTLRGSLTPERTWWDVLHYAITVTPDYPTKTIRGNVVLKVKALTTGQRMQLDLQEPMQLDDAFGLSQSIKFTREGNVYFLNFDQPVEKGLEFSIDLTFSGKPREAIRPPWDGGWIWAKDAKGRPWMSVACQGLGASVWFPCKDHQSDEPDQGALLTIVVPDTLVAVGNGKLRGLNRLAAHVKAYTWEVKNPINSYNIITYIGKYVHWEESFSGELGELTCDYWVLDYELEKAKAQFQQVPAMLKCFEHWFGPYPFYEDGFKLVQSPHLGMEHQSAVAYGNGFNNGYLGRDLSQTGWGLKWDFIIVHESGHEWFGNNITTNDIADMWVHESFTNYSETLFTTCEYGVEAGNDYVIGTRANIRNDIPIIGKYGVNRGGSGDMYYKGGNMLHTIRQLIGNDEKFRSILRGLNKTFYHQTVTTRQIENYIIEQSGINLTKVFDQYLRTTLIPVLEYRMEGKKIFYRWTNCVAGFDMRVKLTSGTWITPHVQWKRLKGKTRTFEPDRNFYITVKKITANNF
ncbi:MAG: M1 family metallopeptidase [Cyclobacteriaceae bacterium]|nr:M1 family metallopeptidase [Cyclobacteriaceae bacterium]